MILGGSVCLFSFLLDKTYCKKSFELVCKETPSLYIESMYANLLNMIVIGPITYSMIETIFINKFTFYIQPLNLSIILLFHNGMYYLVHYYMHKPLLNSIHKFHHKFDKYLLPSMGTAVSPQEFIIAYMSPFIISANYLRPNQITFITAISIISTLNMAIHTKELENMKWHKYLVSPFQHIEHHKIKNKHYSAPLINIDYFMDNKKD